MQKFESQGGGHDAKPPPPGLVSPFKEFHPSLDYTPGYRVTNETYLKFYLTLCMIGTLLNLSFFLLNIIISDLQNNNPRLVRFGAIMIKGNVKKTTFYSGFMWILLILVICKMVFYIDSPCNCVPTWFIFIPSIGIHHPSSIYNLHSPL